MGTARDKVYEAGIADNVAAVSANFHQHHRHQETYERYGEVFGGFPGFWVVCARLGMVISEAEAAGLEHVDWIEFCERVVDLLYSWIWISGAIPDEEDLRKLVQQAAQEVE